MSTRVEHARDRNLPRNLVATSRSSFLHQALYARQYRFGVKLAFTVTPDKFHCSAVSTTFLPYSFEERQVASVRICASRCAFRWREYSPRVRCFLCFRCRLGECLCLGWPRSSCLPQMADARSRVVTLASQKSLMFFGYREFILSSWPGPARRKGNTLKVWSASATVAVQASVRKIFQR